MTKTRFRVGAGAVLVGVTLIVAACGGSASSSSSSSAVASSSAAAGASTSAASAAGAVKVSTAKGSSGSYLVGPNGHALYLWMGDSGGKSNCSGGCASAWPPLATKGAPTAGSGVTAADLGMIKRSDGTEQVTYKGHPLYYFSGDSGAGQTSGEGSSGFGAKWWLVSSAGSAITGSGAASSSSSASGGY